LIEIKGRLHIPVLRHDVRGTADHFVENFQDDGQTDMVVANRAYRDLGYGGPVRVDHDPTMAGEENATPGYETLGRLNALGYIRGIVEAVAHKR
jgi:mannonate dehydratase